MTSFALITEGITDQAILENLLDGLTYGAATTKALRPLRDETDMNRVTKGEFSNWELVLEFVKSEEILDAIQTSDFIVIQIDTDECDHQNFGVSLHKQGKMKSIEEILTECINKIKSILHKDFPKTEMNRLLFAIPVLSSECWLIGLHDTNHIHTEKTSIGCDLRLSNLLMKKNRKISKEYLAYSNLSAGFRKEKIVNAASTKISCLKFFIDQTRRQLAVEF